MDFPNYTHFPFHYERRKTSSVRIGDVWMGSDFPIRVQSMTTTNTMDTDGSVQQIIRMVESGCELVRLTAPSLKEAANLGEIKKKLTSLGIRVPLVADIHFTPNAAELAARLVEKVRVNPGNYVDRKKFEIHEYSESDYQEELERIRDKFLPLVKICKEYGTAMRIGTNHGSLSDRIMSRYGDNPLGMVESALEFLRIARDENYHQIVLSMKASNPLVMIQAYRLLVSRMDAENMHYPLHIGVTEAGDGEDGRIKSAVGIGALLEEGLGDTVRVSLTEDPEFEAPVARKIIERYTKRTHKAVDIQIPHNVIGLNPYEYHKLLSNEVDNLGGLQVPRVVADISHLPEIHEIDLHPYGHIYDAQLDKWHMTDQGVDYIYPGNREIPFMLPNGLKKVVPAKLAGAQDVPLYQFTELDHSINENRTHWVFVSTEELSGVKVQIQPHPQRVWVISTSHSHSSVAIRQGIFQLRKWGLSEPIVLKTNIKNEDAESLVLHSAAEAGTLLADGMGDGVWLAWDHHQVLAGRTAFGILQACRCRISKTEYISCPSCGRTLFDLQDTTAKIRKKTDHLKGVKIGIMGCIVNGPGEMADADFGYVGSGPGKITLYKGQEVMKKNVPENEAVDQLISLIKDHGRWIEPEVFS